MTAVAVVGAGGMLGHDLMVAIPGARGFVHAELDIRDAEAVESALGDFDVIINAVAYNRVDDAESDTETAMAVNASGPEHLARTAARSGAKLIHVSTDYVFDGSATKPYREDAPRHPMSAYGRSKAEGEVRALAANPGGTAIVRTAWLYGEHGGSFPRTMLRLARERDTVSVVTDQIGQPTWTVDLARQIAALIEKGAPAGIYHGTASGETSWYGFAREVYQLAGLDPERVQPTDSTAFVRPAPRPAYSVLGHGAWDAIGIAPQRDWRAQIAEAMALGILDR